MDKVDIGPQAFIYPMPVVLVGADIDSGPNFMPMAWVNRVQYSPPRLALGMGKSHATHAGVVAHGELSVNVPSVDMVEITDWCGLNSASRGSDKSGLFTVFRGALDHAPMIAECPLAMECRIHTTVDLGSHDLLVVDIVGSWTEERFLEGGKPDITAMRPFMLTMPDNRFWAVGDQVADAWSVGRRFTAQGGRRVE